MSVQNERSKSEHGSGFWLLKT